MKNKETVLERHLLAMQNTIGVYTPVKAKEFILRAMHEYAESAVNEYIDGSNKQKRIVLRPLYGIYARLTWDELVMKLRLFNLRRVKRIVQSLSNEDKRKYYIIQVGDVAYKYISTRDIEHNKKIRVFGKNVDAIKLHETADIVVTPKK
jgi:phosphopentomutase